MTRVRLKCSACKKMFDKPLKQYNQSKKRGQTVHYCKHSCATGFDKRLSMFKRTIHQARQNSKASRWRPNQGKEFNISLEYIAKLWKKQKGRCALTNVKMEAPNYHYHKGNPARKLWQASLDRTDNKKGYIEGNVQWVMSFANWGKNKNSNKEAKKVIKMIKEA